MRGLRLWEVSIPYGTIKRIVTGPPCASRQRLQFLMVQLKAYRLSMMRYAPECFNSLWYN